MSLGETWERMRNSPVVLATAAIGVLVGLGLLVKMLFFSKPPEVVAVRDFYCQSCDTPFPSTDALPVERPKCPKCGKEGAVQPHYLQCPNSKCAHVFAGYFTRPSDKTVAAYAGKSMTAKEKAALPAAGEGFEIYEVKTKKWLDYQSKEGKEQYNLEKVRCPKCAFQQAPVDSGTKGLKFKGTRGPRG